MQTNTQAATTYKFRVVVRGTDATGRRVRRVLTTPARTHAEAALACDQDAAVKGLNNLYLTVLPPLH